MLRSTNVELIPIVGIARRVDLGEAGPVHEGRWLPGKWVWGKRAFTFRSSAWNPLAFAVPESVANRWSPLVRGTATGATG